MDRAGKGTIPDSLRGARSVVEVGSESRSNSWQNSLDDDMDSASALNALIATLRQKQSDLAAGTSDSRSAFTATSSLGQSSEMESATCNGPAVKRVRRTNHSQRHFAPTTSVFSAMEANSSISALDNLHNLEYFSQIQRIYQTSLLNNTLASNPELMFRLQQLNALQQAFNAQSLLSLQPNLLSAGSIGMPEQHSVKPSTTSAAHQTGAANLALNALLAPVAQNSSLSFLGSLIRQINANAEQAPTIGLSNAERVRRSLGQQSIFSGLNTQRDGNVPNEPWNASFDPAAFYNLVQQQCVAAALAATKQTTASSLPVVVNGQDNELTTAATVVVTSSAVPTTSTTQSCSSAYTRRLQQIPVCRRALEARFARILAQELEASDEEHDRRMKGNLDEDMDADTPEVFLTRVERKSSSTGAAVGRGRATRSASPAAADAASSHCQQLDCCVASTVTVPAELSAECTSTQNSSSVDTNKSDATQQPDTPAPRYPVLWQGIVALKTNEARIQMHRVGGNIEMLKRSLVQLATMSNNMPVIRINQRMRMEASQLESVQSKMTDEQSYIALICLSCGFNKDDIRNQSEMLKERFVDYLESKQAAGICNVGNEQHPSPNSIVHVFPPCEFATTFLQRNSPDLFETIRQQRANYLFVVITSAS